MNNINKSAFTLTIILLIFCAAASGEIITGYQNAQFKGGALDPDIGTDQTPPIYAQLAPESLYTAAGLVKVNDSASIAYLFIQDRTGLSIRHYNTLIEKQYIELSANQITGFYTTGGATIVSALTSSGLSMFRVTHSPGNDTFYSETIYSNSTISGSVGDSQCSGNVCAHLSVVHMVNAKITVVNTSGVQLISANMSRIPNRHCFPFKPRLGVADYTGDGVVDYLMYGYRDDPGNGVTDYNIFLKVYLNASSDQYVSQYSEIARAGSSETIIECANGASQVSPVVIADFDFDSSNGLEIIYGGGKWSGNYIRAARIYPTIADYDTIIDVGSYALYGAYPHYFTDKCVAFDGVDYAAGSNASMLVVCNYQATSWWQQLLGIDSTEYRYFYGGYKPSMTSPVNTISSVTASYTGNKWVSLSAAGAVEMVVVDDDRLFRHYIPAVPNMTFGMITASHLGSTYDYVYSLGNGSMYAYFDSDGGSSCSAAGCASLLRFNPCITDEINLGTRSSVAVTVDSPDGVSRVAIRVSSYVGEPAENVSAWSSYVSDGAIVSQWWTATDLTVASTLRIELRTESFPEGVQVYDYNFAVVNGSGVDYGDTQCSEDVSPADDVPGGATTDPGDGNTIDNIVDEIDSFTGLGSTAIWVLLMVFVAVAIIYSNGAGFSSLIIMLIVEFLLIVLGAVLGFIGVGIIILIALLGIAAIGLILKKVFMPGGG